MTEITDLPTMSPTSQKRARKSPPGIGGLINLALMVWMIWDLRHRSDEELNGKRKWWMLAAFAPPIGPIAYFIYLRRRTAQVTEIPVEVAAQA
jgi:hypothetical protein